MSEAVEFSHFARTLKCATRMKSFSLNACVLVPHGVCVGVPVRQLSVYLKVLSLLCSSSKHTYKSTTSGEFQ